MGKKLQYLGEENRKIGKEYDNFGHFPKIKGSFFYQELFSSPFVQKADLNPMKYSIEEVQGNTLPIRIK